MLYRSPADCLESLNRLNPANVIESQTALTGMLTALLEGSAAPNQHLEVLEAARDLVASVQSQLALRYATRPLRPDTADDKLLTEVVSLWRLMARSYAQVTRRDAAAGTLDDQRALLSQRRVFYSGQSILEYFRAHRALPNNIWIDLHESFSMAEAQGVAGTRVSDPLNEVWRAQSALEAYISVLLVDLGNPYGRGSREFGWICRWAQRFAPYCSLTTPEAEQTEIRGTAYGLNLGLDHGLRPFSALASNPGLRRFDGSKLAGQIQAVFNQFKQGVKPAALGLGKDCSTEASARLLLTLYRPWGLGSAGRRFPRKPCKGQLELTSDWLAIGFHVSGKRFEQPGQSARSSVRSLRSDISLLTFGERAEEVPSRDPQQQRRYEAEKLGFTCENWEMLDQSVGGFRLKSATPGENIEFHQLVAIRPPDGKYFLLAQVSWLIYRNDGAMEIGVSMLNGVPKVVAARIADLTASPRSAYQQAFELPAVPSLKTAASLVIPSGWFQPHRVIEIHGDKITQVRLDQALMRGTNFDQVSYDIISSGA